jgi:hypothetical protein
LAEEPITDRQDNGDAFEQGGRGIASPEEPRKPPTGRDLRHKLIRGGILLAVLVAVGVGVLGLLPGLSGVRRDGLNFWWVYGNTAYLIVSYNAPGRDDIATKACDWAYTRTLFNRFTNPGVRPR